MEENGQQAAPQAAPQSEPQSAPQESSGPRLRLNVDERTGRRTVEPVREEPPKEEKPAAPAQVFNNPTGEQAAQQAEPQASQQEVPQQTAPQQAPQPIPQAPQPAPQPVMALQPAYYTPAEMSLAMQLGQVDESRIPPAYQPQYQALKQKNAPPPKSEAELRNEFLDKVNQMARDKAMKDVGLTADEAAMGDFSDNEELRGKMERFKAALEVNRARIVNDYSEQLRVQQLQARQAAEFANGVRNWINEQKATEPHFDDIGRFMETHINEMPYEKAVKVAPSVQRALQGKLTPQDAEIVRNFYEECRKEFYARQNGTSTTPAPRSPSVETKGTGKGTEAPTDYAKMLSSASPRDKPQIVREWLSSLHKG